jgi:D-alanyl-D-alanine carboxypeptidase (penicillin-binding protein 5/6)
VLLECETGEIYFSKNADEKLPMASTTKIMTALVALENSDPSDTVIIDRRAVGVEGSSVYLLEGELLDYFVDVFLVELKRFCRSSNNANNSDCAN